MLADSSPVKPILMCFICKLSFSSAKSFLLHSVGEHRVELTDKEKEEVKAKMKEFEAEREQLKMKVHEQEKALSGDPTAPSNRMLRAKIKAQIQSSTMR